MKKKFEFFSTIAVILIILTALVDVTLSNVEEDYQNEMLDLILKVTVLYNDMVLAHNGTPLTFATSTHETNFDEVGVAIGYKEGEDTSRIYVVGANLTAEQVAGDIRDIKEERRDKLFLIKTLKTLKWIFVIASIVLLLIAINKGLHNIKSNNQQTI